MKTKALFESQTRSVLLKVKRNQILLIFLLCTRVFILRDNLK
jgi:hypothetical protein